MSILFLGAIMHVQHDLQVQARINPLCNENYSSCWIIWKERNRAVFNYCTLDPLLTIRNLIFFIEEMSLTKNFNAARRSTLNHSHRSLFWVKPPPDFVKINSDLAWKENSPFTMIASLTRNHSGLVICGSVKRIQSFSPTCRWGKNFTRILSFGSCSGSPKVISEMDSSLLFAALNNPQQSSWDIIATVQTVLTLKNCSSLHGFLFNK